MVAVRYAAAGCTVQLEVLSNCIAQGTYAFTPYSARETKTARTATELFGTLPIGAARLAGSLKGSRALKTDYRLVGMVSLPANAVVAASDLFGTVCACAAHVVSAIDFGGFAMAAGESREIDAVASVFALSAGASKVAVADRLDQEGEPAACDQAITTMTEQPLCAAPLLVGLLPIRPRGGRSADHDGKACLPAARRSAAD